MSITSVNSQSPAASAALSVGCQRVADATAAAGGYLSEFAQLCAVWNGKLDASGDLQGKDGVALTSHEDDPVPDPMGALAAQRGQVANLGGPSDAIDWQTTLQWPAQGQSRTFSSGLANGYAEMDLVVPSNLAAGTDNTHMGYFRFAEVPGGAVLARDITITVNGRVVVANAADGDTAPSFNFTFGNPDGWQAQDADFNLQPGDVVKITLRNCANDTQQPGDFLLDLASPTRY